MIITEQKPLQEIFSLLHNESVFLIGCNECATLCHTGGEPEVLEMKKKLEEKNIQVTGFAILDPACHKLNNKRMLKPYIKQIEQAKHILILSCGDGLQVLTELYPEKHLISGTNTLFLGAELQRGRFDKQCALCGFCIADQFEGLCPVSRCPKSMLNGPCGGSMNGSCELSEHLPCIWDEIIKRRIKNDKIEQMKIIEKPKDWTPYKSYNWRDHHKL